MSKLDGVNLSRSPVSLGVLAFRGPEAARFLQGQLSADIEKLSVGASTLAGLHNPQGRVVALLAVVRVASDELFAVLPAELAAAVAQRLRKYVLRAKLKIEELGDALTVVGTSAEVAGSATPGFPSIEWGARRLLLVPAQRLDEFSFADTGAERWQAADVAAGLPQVYAATSEAFVAQMLNLDLLGAIAFDKGCYTGQEVIARSHYRGRVKRRLQRWFTEAGAPLRAGDSARSADGRTLSIVRVAAVPTGQELLAVGPYAVSEEPDGGAAGRVTSADVSALVEGPLPLPYPLPA
jgi:tRNA-modifying protein YgfZ